MTGGSVRRALLTAAAVAAGTAALAPRAAGARAPARTAPAPRSIEANSTPRLPLDPGALVLSARPVPLLLRNRARARVDVRRTDRRHAPGARWRASLGEVRGAAYDPGLRRAPAVALLAAEAMVDGKPLRGVTCLPLIGRGTLPTHTSAGATVTVEVAGRTFGPLRADARGDVTVPVEVPPEARHATVHAIDQHGLSTRITLPLPQEPFPQGVLVAPAGLAPGERGTVTIYAVTDRSCTARPRTSPPPVVTVDGRALRLESPPRPVAPGRWEAAVVAVAPAPAGARVDATVDDVPLAPATVRVTAPPPPEPVAPRQVGVRLGGATAFGSLASLVVAGEVRWLHAWGPVPLALGIDLAVARGVATSFRGRSIQAEVTQASLGVGASVRFALGAGVSFATGAGMGVAAAHSEVVEIGATRQNGGDVAPFVFVASAVGLATRVGEVFLDGRWVDLRLDEFSTKVEGNAIGLAVALGYRIPF